MKSKFIFLFLVFFVFMLCGCQVEPKCDVNGHTWQDPTYTTPKTCTVCGETTGDVLETPKPIEIDEKMKAEIDDAWGGKFGYSNGFTNYGIFNGYLILLNSYVSYYGIVNNYMIEDAIFKYNFEFDIYAYKNGKFINIIDCYKLNILNIEEIKIISNYHKEYYKSKVKSYSGFDLMYDSLDNIAVIYDTKDELVLENNISSDEITSINSQYGRKFEYHSYYGKHNDYHVFLIENSESASNNFLLGNTVFRWFNNFDLMVFVNGMFLNIDDAYIQGYLSLYDLEKIGMIHYNNVIKRINVTDYDQYEKEYNDKWTLDYFIDSNGNYIDVYEKLTEEEIKEITGREFSVNSYYGKYQDYYVFFSPGDWGIITRLIFDGVIFNYPYNFNIYFYKDGECKTIQKLYENGELTKEVLVNISYYHKMNYFHQFYVDKNYVNQLIDHNDFTQTSEIYVNGEKLMEIGNYSDIRFIAFHLKDKLQTEMDQCLGEKYIYDKYLGSYGDWHMFVVEDEESGYHSYKIGEFEFNDLKLFRIDVYNSKEKQFYDICDLYQDELMSDELIQKYAYVFKLLKRYQDYYYKNEIEFDILYNAIIINSYKEKVVNR